jgi:hypothetical protein
MATVITLTPNVSTWSIGDPLITVSLSGGNAGTGSEYMWETNNGSFSNKFLAAPVLTPKNATKVTTIYGRRVFHSAYSGTLNVATVGSYGGLTKTSGTNTWDSFGFQTPNVTAYPSFYEVTAGENNKEKAMGFLANSTYRDPTTVNSNPDLTFCVAWHLLTNGTAIARATGIALSTPIPYKAGDRFRVTLTTSSVSYSINGVVYATTMLPTTSALYPTMSFKTTAASFLDGSYLADPTNDGSTTLNVMGVVPIQANYSYELVNDNITMSSIAEDGGLYFRKRGRVKKALALNFRDKSYADFVLLNDFWKAHERQEIFLYKDLVANETYVMRFESGLQISVEHPDVITIQATLKEI